MTGVLHIVLARKPVEGTVAENCLQWGCGALWIDGCRVTINPAVDDPRLGGVGTWQSDTQGKKVYASGLTGERTGSSPLGRFPANLILGGCAVVQMGEQSGVSKSSGGRTIKRSGGTYVGGAGDNVKKWSNDDPGFGDTGTAARFFFNFAEQESDE